MNRELKREHSRRSTQHRPALKGQRLSHSTQNPHRNFPGAQASTGIPAAAAAACALFAFQATANDSVLPLSVLPLSVPAKVLSTTGDDPASETVQTTMTPGVRPQPTLPGARLPQYQLGHRHRRIPADTELKNPRLRLILALTSRPILIDATITIDGEPYLTARERRIQQILKAAAEPAPPAALEPSESVTATEAASVTDTVEPNRETALSTTDQSADESAVSETPDSESTSVPEESSEAPEDAEPEAEPVSPPTVPAYRLPETVPERIRRYIAAKGEPVSADEVRWLLTKWIDGPVLLMLSDNFQRFRANQRPVFNVLDVNRDGTISSEEISGAVTAFEKCDFNRNDIIEYTELAKVAADPRLRNSQHAGPGKLIFRIPDAESAIATYQRIAARYASAEPGAAPLVPRFDASSNGRFDPEELAVLNAANPDLSFTISFNTSEPAESRIELTAAGPDIGAVGAARKSAAGSISLPIGGTTVSFAAVQSGASDQISIGAVNDGYPMLPVLDPNEDGRFTIRERRGLVKSLQSFDRNRDGRLTREETQATIRICFGLGPLVHRELIALREVNPNSESTVIVGPDWFKRMDRNGDNDISRNEFPGRAEHFQALDADNDELISAREALDFDAASSKPAEPASSGDSSTDSTTEETATKTGSSI